MKLFLASSSKSLPLLSKQLPKGAKVLFSANASDNYSGDKWWVQADRDALLGIGCEITELDIRSTSPREFKNKIKNHHLLHFSGGSVLYLLSLIKKMELSEVIAHAVKSKEIIYSGTSAGSMIASYDLRLSSYDEEDKEYAKDMKDFSGLELVNFLIIPHVNNKEFIKSNVQMVEHLADNLQTLIFLNDDQAIWAEDNKMELMYL